MAVVSPVARRRRPIAAFFDLGCLVAHLLHQVASVRSASPCERASRPSWSRSARLERVRGLPQASRRGGSVLPCCLLIRWVARPSGGAVAPRECAGTTLLPCLVDDLLDLLRRAVCRCRCRWRRRRWAWPEPGGFTELGRRRPRACPGQGPARTRRAGTGGRTRRALGMGLLGDEQLFAGLGVRAVEHGG